MSDSVTRICLLVTNDDGWSYWDYVDPDVVTYFKIHDKEDHLKVLTKPTQKGLQYPDGRVEEKYPRLMKKVEVVSNNL